MTASSLRRVVLDTNVVISSLLVPASPSAFVRNAIEQSGLLLASAATISELEEVLRRPKFARVLSQRIRTEFLKRYRAAALLIPVKSSIQICRDPRDDKLLELALDGGADYLVTGDTDLQILDPFRGIRIVSPRNFLSVQSPGKP